MDELGKQTLMNTDIEIESQDPDCVSFLKQHIVTSGKWDIKTQCACDEPLPPWLLQGIRPLSLVEVDQTTSWWKQVIPDFF